jgi:sigma-E factor negative regulatory protein RseC
MDDTLDDTPDYGAPALVEGFAHVVAVESEIVWLEPEQTTSCGHCASSSACGGKGGIGTLADRLEARRFALPNRDGLRIGERVVIGVSEKALVKASLTAYAIPLASALFCGAMAQWAAGSDLVTMVAMVGGLALGLVGARLNAGRLNARGELTPRYLRRADVAITCHF